MGLIKFSGKSGPNSIKPRPGYVCGENIQAIPPKLIFQGKLASGMSNIISSAIDLIHGYVFFGGIHDFGLGSEPAILRLKIPAFNSPTYLQLSQNSTANLNLIRKLAINPDNPNTLIALGSCPVNNDYRIWSIDIPSFSETSGVLTNGGTGGFIVVDNSDNFVYNGTPILFGSAGSPGVVYKTEVNVGDIANDSLGAGETGLGAGTGDPNVLLAVLAVNMGAVANPTRAILFNLATMTEAGHIILSGTNSGSGPEYNSCDIDTLNKIAYIGQDNGISAVSYSSGILEKAFGLYGFGDNTDSGDGVTIFSNPFVFHACSNTYGVNPDIIVGMDNTLTVKSHLLLPANESVILSGSGDPYNRNLYVCSYQTQDILQLSY